MAGTKEEMSKPFYLLARRKLKPNTLNKPLASPLWMHAFKFIYSATPLEGRSLFSLGHGQP